MNNNPQYWKGDTEGCFKPISTSYILEKGLVIADLLRSKGGYPAPHETLLSAKMAGGQYKLRHPPLLRLNLLSFDTTGLQAGNEIFLAADEDDQHGDQARYGHGKDVAPLGELMLAEKA